MGFASPLKGVATTTSSLISMETNEEAQTHRINSEKILFFHSLPKSDTNRIKKRTTDFLFIVHRSITLSLFEVLLVSRRKLKITNECATADFAVKNAVLWKKEHRAEF
jgi:hypothetical protein